jgi:hypothetical protein
MGARPIGNGNTLHVPGLYEKVRDKELNDGDDDEGERS